MDNSTLERWRALDLLSGLNTLGSYVQDDKTSDSLIAQGIDRLHVEGEGREFDLLICGAKSFEIRREGGGASNLVMHVRRVNFKGATNLRHRAAV